MQIIILSVKNLKYLKKVRQTYLLITSPVIIKFFKESAGIHYGPLVPGGGMGIEDRRCLNENIITQADIEKCVKLLIDDIIY